ncbi:hypothetical protein CTA1_11820 [Colletotrichum tanaceti]|uniref:Uncharacterized protein n=1 Tax=Colletotrichum tanaceti TaxID=1306861 RepID=A0A4V6DG14_9PEZI|nr:hypothetical protein CTA1_11820 [Colletotrichum tanaceti]
MKCYCYSHGILRNIEHTSIACQKRAGQGVQGIRRKGYCYIDEDEVDLFKDVRVPLFSLPLRTLHAKQVL